MTEGIDKDKVKYDVYKAGATDPLESDEDLRTGNLPVGDYEVVASAPVGKTEITAKVLITISEPVVEVSGKGYATLEQALAALTWNDTERITFKKNCIADGLTLAGDKIIIDLQGRTLTLTKGIEIKGETDAIFPNGAILADSTMNSPIFKFDAKQVKFYDVIVDGSGLNSSVVNDFRAGDVTISNSKFTADTNKYAISIADSGAKVVVVGDETEIDGIRCYVSDTPTSSTKLTIEGKGVRSLAVDNKFSGTIQNKSGVEIEAPTGWEWDKDGVLKPVN